MRLQFKEPVNPRYIHINKNINKKPVTETVHLLLPIAGGVDIATDNTCKSTKALQDFFGNQHGAALHRKSALDELAHYKKALEHDIALIVGNDNPLKVAKQQRLVQINQYIALVRTLKSSTEMSGLQGYADYPPSIRALMAERTNLYSMHLRPSEMDNLIRSVEPVFSVDRRPHGGTLFNALRSGYQLVNIKTQSPQQQIKTAVLAERKGKPVDFLAIQAVLIQQAEALFGAKKIDFRKASDGTSITKDYIDAIMMFDKSATTDDYVDALISSCMADFVPTSPFNISNNQEKTEKLSLLTQFFLGEVNIFCYANNLSKSNFGKVLDASAALSDQLVKTVKSALEMGTSVESATIHFINQNRQSFGLTQPITSEQMAAISQKFNHHYNTVKEAPHFDEFVVLDSGKAGKFVTHQGSLCVDLSEVMLKLPSRANMALLKEVQADYATMSRDVPPTNEHVQASYEIDEHNLAAYLQQLLHDINNVDEIVTLLTSQTESSKLVFQEVKDDVINALKGSDHWSILKRKILAQLPSNELQQAFNTRFSANEQQVALSSELANSLYIEAIMRVGPDRCPGYATTEQLNQILAHLKIEGHLEESPAGFVLNTTPAVARQISAISNSHRNEMYISQPMAANLYKEVVSRYGENSAEVRQMNSLSNDPKAMKFQRALQLLDISIDVDTIGFPGEYLGYLLQATTAQRQTMENIHISRSRFYLTQNMAAALYKQAVANGFDDLLRSLNNERAPDKIVAALTLLGLEFSNISFHEKEGYLVTMTPQVQAHVLNIEAGTVAALPPSEAGRSALIRQVIYQIYQAHHNQPLPASGGRGGLTQIEPEAATLQQASQTSTAGSTSPVRLRINNIIEGVNNVTQAFRAGVTNLGTRNPREPGQAAAASQGLGLRRRMRGWVNTFFPSASASNSNADNRISVERVHAFRNQPIPHVINPESVQLNCPDRILTAFQRLLEGSAVLGCTLQNPYTQERITLPTQASELTARHLQLLARNESENTNGVMKVELYNGKLTSNQIAEIRCLVKATNVAGVAYPEAWGGFHSPNTPFDHPPKTIVIDQAGLQWQGDLRNTGGMFFYPSDAQNTLLPPDYVNWQQRMYLAMYGQQRPANPSSNTMTVTWQNVTGQLDLDQFTLAIDAEFSQALDAAVTQGETALTGDQRINFKFLKAGMGFFASGLHGKDTARFELARLKGIEQALRRIESLSPAEKLLALGRLGRIELPFSSEGQITQSMTDTLNNIQQSVIRLGLLWGGTPQEDAFKQCPGFVTAVTNCGDPHAMPGNESGHHSVDASMATNAFLDHLNAFYNSSIDLRVSPPCIPAPVNSSVTQVVANPSQQASPNPASQLRNQLNEVRRDTAQGAPNRVNEKGQAVLKEFILESTRMLVQNQWVLINTRGLHAGKTRNEGLNVIATEDYHVTVQNNNLTVKDKHNAYSVINDPNETNRILNEMLLQIPENVLVETFLKAQANKLASTGFYASGVWLRLNDACGHVGINQDTAIIMQGGWEFGRAGGGNLAFASVRNNPDYKIEIERATNDIKIYNKTANYQEVTGADKISVLQQVSRAFPDLQQALALATPAEENQQRAGL